MIFALASNQNSGISVAYRRHIGGITAAKQRHNGGITALFNKIKEARQ